MSTFYEKILKEVHEKWEQKGHSPSSMFGVFACEVAHMAVSEIAKERDALKAELEAARNQEPVGIIARADYHPEGTRIYASPVPLNYDYSFCSTPEENVILMPTRKEPPCDTE